MSVDKQNINTFNVSEIFYSIQGESSLAGYPCIFIRLQGCNMRCSWCDTKYALNIKKVVKLMNADEILGKVREYNCNFVCFTGGEPLQQAGTIDLLKQFCEEGFVVSLETNGHYSLENVDTRVKKVVDLKCPASKMTKLNNYKNLEFLNSNDEIKFVIENKKDYNWAKEIIVKYGIPDKDYNIIFSPVFKKMDAKKLSKWILRDNLKVRLQLQIHKYIWNPKKRGV